MFALTRLYIFTGQVFKTHVVEDAVSSRDLVNKEVAIRRMAQSGATPSCVEMVVLELVNIQLIQILKRFKI